MNAAPSRHNRAHRRIAVPAPTFRRQWALPCADTTRCAPIGEWVRFYLRGVGDSVDPFARDCPLACWRNDLNPETRATYHEEAIAFLRRLKDRRVGAEVAIFDPPYSRNQLKASYAGVGRAFGQEDAQQFTTNWQPERDALDEIMLPGGVVLSLGWNSSGMGVARGYTLLDVLLVCHGGASNGTICIAERKDEPHPEFSL